MDQPSRRTATATIHVAVPFISGVSQNELLEGELVFDPADPYAVTMHLEARSGAVVWTFARELLADGIYQPSGKQSVMGSISQAIQNLGVDGSGRPTVSYANADDELTQAAGRAIREACLEAVADGIRTADLSGHHGTTEFTDEVIRRTRTKIEVWSSL